MVLKNFYPKSTYRLKVPLNSCIDFTKNFDRLNFFYGTVAFVVVCVKSVWEYEGSQPRHYWLRIQAKAKTTAVKGMHFFLEIMLCILDYFFFSAHRSPGEFGEETARKCLFPISSLAIPSPLSNSPVSVFQPWHRNQGFPQPPGQATARPSDGSATAASSGPTSPATCWSGRGWWRGPRGSATTTCSTPCWRAAGRSKSWASGPWRSTAAWPRSAVGGVSAPGVPVVTCGGPLAGGSVFRRRVRRRCGGFDNSFRNGSGAPWF